MHLFGHNLAAVAADLDSPSSVPRSAESDLPATTAKSAAHLGDPSSACALASFGSPLRPPSTAQSATRRAVVRTSAHARARPSPPAPSFPGPRDRDKTFPLPRDAGVAVPATPQCPYPQTQFAESPGGSLLL